MKKVSKMKRKSIIKVLKDTKHKHYVITAINKKTLLNQLKNTKKKQNNKQIL